MLTLNETARRALSVISPGIAACEDTGRLAILVDDHEVGEVPGNTLRNDPLQSQTSSVVHVGIWDHRCQLLTKPRGPLRDTNHKTITVLNSKKNAGKTLLCCLS